MLFLGVYIQTYKPMYDCTIIVINTTSNNEHSYCIRV